MDVRAFDLVQQLAASHYLVRALHVAAELGLADAVSGDSTAIVPLATRVGADPDALRRLLTLLASRGIFEIDGGHIGHTPASELLRRDHPQSLLAFVRMFGQSIHWRSAGELRHAIATGEAVVPRLFPDGGLWGYYAAHPDEGRVFDGAMAAKASVQIADVLAAHDFSSYRRIADIGGGAGHMLRAILARHSNATGILFDLPPVIDAARGAGPNDRLEFVAGDMFVTPLPAADATIVMEVLHDWDDARCAAILGAIRRTMPPTGRLLIVEIELPDGTGPDWAKMLDLVMLAVFAARQRSNAEYRALLEANGFALARQTSTLAGLTIIEAIPAG